MPTQAVTEPRSQTVQRPSPTAVEQPATAAAAAPAKKFVHPQSAAANKLTAQEKLLARAQSALQASAADAGTVTVPLSAGAVAAARSDGAQESPAKKKPKRDKKRKESGVSADDPAGAEAPESEGKKAKKAKKEKAKKVLLEPAERASGPANTEEAAVMRAALGITAPVTPAAAAATPQPAASKHFNFAFNPQSADDAPAEPDAAAAQPDNGAVSQAEQDMQARLARIKSETPGQQYVARRCALRFAPGSTWHLLQLPTFKSAVSVQGVFRLLWQGLCGWHAVQL